MPVEPDILGIVTELQERRETYARFIGKAAPDTVTYQAPPQAPPVKTYRPPSLGGLIEAVAYQIDASVEAVRGPRRERQLVNARFCIAVLAAEFNPRVSPAAVDAALLRAENMTHWYRERHADRCKLIPGYEALYNRCRHAVLTSNSAGPPKHPAPLCPSGERAGRSAPLPPQAGPRTSSMEND